jgi:Ni,Fe-hydrogenase maturation factor
MTKVYCFGNEHIQNDKLAKEVAGKLNVPGIEFVMCDSVDEIFDAKGTIYIMDVVKGLKEPTIIKGTDHFKLCPKISCHDFDLSYFLKLLQKMGKINDVVIIGLPMLD